MAITLKNAFQYHLRPQHFDPVLIPDSEETVFDSDVFVELVTLSNTHSSAVSVTIKDKQSTPRELIPTAALPANSVFVARFGGRYCPGGLTWQASVADKVVGYVRGRC